ncbi:tRNA threonylcarbamoyladenosine dehydratase [Vibrio stylophorae]|uniref:tRNA threonylcarbamoyladenosine dehydratase n=1 Tax=Vibrio stylophorae TaxID=659351 RepID=A0ABM8ZVA8_9VIBR|nr:tRNA cyclic N6-threonylcarbamoyladenosine(37) synthase TcdA [Vibrio stylophorae]CAH0534262.1 tRNA threonylcarbamoyladenosine dehydratase [Vibrio stylophorae]
MKRPSTAPSEQYQQRFGGTARLYGRDQLEWLRGSHVAVIGIGGVGSWAAEALARTGVGAITLVDMDDVCVTNINRQIHALSETVGQSKIELMAARIQSINPDCQVHLVDDFIGPDNLSEYLSADLDYVLDAIDSLTAKAALLAYCKRYKIKVVSVGGAGGQTDPTQIQVADLTKTIQDPLAAKLRQTLRKQYGFTTNSKRKFGIDCVFSTEQLKYPQQDGSVCAAKASAEGPKRMDCASGFGASAMVTATFGLVAAARVVDKLLEKAARLSKEKSKEELQEKSQKEQDI